MKQSIAKTLRTLRDSSGLSVQQLAERSGVCRAAIHHIEGGKRKNPSVETLKKLCKAMGKSLAEFD